MPKYRKTKKVKDTYVRARCTKDEKALIEKYAAMNNMKVSEFILHLIWRDMEKE